MTYDKGGALKLRCFTLRNALAQVALACAQQCLIVGCRYANLLLVVAFNMDVAGVAIATVASQYLSAVLLFIRLVRFRDENHLNPFLINVDWVNLGKVVRYGMPSAISSASFSFSNIIIQSAINFYGDAAMAGNTAGNNIESFFLFSITTPLCQTAAAFIGQNIGAGNRERSVKIAKQLYVIGSAVIAVFGIVGLIFDREVLSLFVPGNEAAIDFGVIGMDFKLLFCVVYTLLQISNGIMQAFGYTMYQMINSLLGIVGIRLVWMLLVYPLNQTPFMLYLCYPITWTVTMLGSLPVAIILLHKFKKGKDFKL